MLNKIKNKSTNKQKKKGFSLIELVVVIAIMAVLVAVLAPALLTYTEKSRAQKDDSAMSEVTNAIKLAMADPDVYDELLLYNELGNVAGYEEVEDEVVADPNGAMRGVTITFEPVDNKVVVADGKINALMTNATKKGSIGATANKVLNNKLSGMVGEVIDVGSQTYRNSPYTVFISMGTMGGSNLNDMDPVQVYGLWGGTNIPFGGSDVEDVPEESTEETEPEIGSWCEMKKGCEAAAHLDGCPEKCKKEVGCDVEKHENGCPEKCTGENDCQASKHEDGCPYKIVESISDGFAKVTDGEAVYYEISNAQGLLAFKDAVNNKQNFNNAKIVLDGDIDMGGTTWTPFGQKSGSDYIVHAEWGYNINNLTLDGNGYKIKNMVISGSGLFDSLSVGGTLTFKNLTLENVNALSSADTSGDQYRGLFVGSVNSNVAFDNVKISNCEVSGYWALGGFVGKVGGEGGGAVSFNDCQIVDLTIMAPWNYYIASFAGYVASTITFTGNNVVKNYTADVVDLTNYYEYGGAIHSTISSAENVIVENYVIK